MQHLKKWVWWQTHSIYAKPKGFISSNVDFQIPRRFTKAYTKLHLHPSRVRPPDSVALWRLLRSSCSWMNHGIKKEKVPKVSSKPLKWYLKKKATCLHVLLLHVCRQLWKSGGRHFSKWCLSWAWKKKGVPLFLGGQLKLCSISIAQSKRERNALQLISVQWALFIKFTSTSSKRSKVGHWTIHPCNN